MGGFVLDKFQSWIAELYYKNLHKEVELELPESVKRHSLICFLINGFVYFIVFLIISNILLTIGSCLWSDALIENRWIDPFFHSDIQNTDAVTLGANLSSLSTVISGSSFDNKMREGLNQDEIKWLYDQDIVDKVYGFESCLVDLDDGYGIFWMQIGTPETFDMLGYEVMGSGLNTDPDHAPDLPEAMLSGAAFAKYKPGDIVTLCTNSGLVDNYLGSEYLPRPVSEPLRVKVAGKVAFPYQSTTEGFYLSNGYPYFSTSTDNRIFMVYNKSNLEKLSKNGFVVSNQYGTHYITYKPGTSEREIEDFRNYVNSLYRFNNYDYTSPDNIKPATADFLLKPKEPAPAFIRTVMAPAPLLFAAICSLLLLIALSLNIKTSSGSNVPIKGCMVTAHDVVRAAVLMTVLSFIIPYFVLIARCLATLKSCLGEYGFREAFAEMLTSPHLIKMSFAFLVMMLIVLIPSVVFSIRKMKDSGRSEEMSKESYVYREPEYYTPDSYSANDFERADYDLINKTEPEDIVRAVSDSKEDQ